jgi:hypothetical protein
LSKQACSEDEFLQLWNRYQSVSAIAKILNIDERAVAKRRKRISERNCVILPSPHKLSPYNLVIPQNRIRMTATVDNAVIAVGSDAHVWRKELTTAQRAFVAFHKNYQPDYSVLNGDIFDGASISRHPRIGWNNVPDLKEEFEACRHFTDAVYDAAPNAAHVYLYGNHCQRLDNMLANQMPQLQGLPGMSLAELFPKWEFGISLFINKELQIIHKWKGGEYAVANNTKGAGVSYVTGHLHSQKVIPFTDMRGTRWGVDAGCLAATAGEQFDYTMDTPVNWVSGFAVLTIRNGILFPPELCSVVDEQRGTVWFRGTEIAV